MLHLVAPINTDNKTCMQKYTKMELGKFGEDIAADRLAKSGYQILTRNFHSKYGEIDIVALKNDILFFFEVKTRTCNSINAPEESITYQKRQKLIRTAMTFLENKALSLPKIKSWRIAFFGILLRGEKVIKTENFIID